MKWITREHVKVDRVACPWLIKKFVDKNAEFIFVPPEKVMEEAKRLDAIPYDVKNVELGHHGKISVAILTAAAGSKWVATAQQRQGSVFIAGDRPVTEDQVRVELQAEGWSNVQIQRDGKVFDVSGTKYGRPISLAIDAETGRLRNDDDDDDDDGD